MNATYLVVPKSELGNYSFQADRDYFATPVEVRPLYCEIATGLVYVSDDRRGDTYPTLKSQLKSWYALTNKQRDAVGDRDDQDESVELSDAIAAADHGPDSISLAGYVSDSARYICDYCGAVNHEADGPCIECSLI